MSSNPTTTSAAKISLFEQCVSLCEHCLALLDQPACLDDEFAVHEWRVATKRLRSAWHLVAAADRKFAKRRRAALRALSASIAGQRDRDVLLNLAADLQSDSEGAHFSLLLEQLSQCGGVDPAAAPDCEQLRAQWNEECLAWRNFASQFDNPHILRKTVRRALRKSERIARQRTRCAIEDARANAEQWHEWRKAVKRLRYQREFIATSQGRQLGVRDGRIARLGTRLGERNDIANLIEVVEAMPDLSRQQHGQIRKAIAGRERSVLSSARRLGRLAFLR